MNPNALEQIKAIAVDVIRATSRILDDVEVVVMIEREGGPISLNANYLKRKNNGVWEPFVSKIFADPRVTVIDDPGHNPLCKGCSHENNCPQTLEIIVPFKVGDFYVGYISVVAFSEEARANYLAKQEQVIDFLRMMVDLIAGAGKEHVSRLEAEQSFKELDAVIQHMESVIITCDREGAVQHTNKAFRRLLGRAEPVRGLRLPDLLDSPAIAGVFESNEDMEDQECDVVVNNAIHRQIVSAKVVRDESGKPSGYIFAIRSLDDVRRYMSKAALLPHEEVLRGIVGQSGEMRELRESVKRFAASVSTVLVSGETGAGKELVARALHNLGPRRDKPFVAINCSAIPDTLLESELFGYEQGTFTGANKGGKAGLFELGNGGSIFLDEVGDMPIHLQAKLLRVLQDKRIIRLGGFRPIDLDIRIIAATNQPLDLLVRNRKFRQDLYYRLNILPVRVPALRDRPADINELVFHFLQKHNRNLGKKVVGVRADAMESLKRYPWPGNVRELENAVEYAVNLEVDQKIARSSLPPEIAGHAETGHSLKSRLKDYEKALIADVIARRRPEPDGINASAAELGISRASLYQKIREYEIGG